MGDATYEVSPSSNSGMAPGDAMLAWIAETVSADIARFTSEGIAHGAIRGAGEIQ